MEHPLRWESDCEALLVSPSMVTSPSAPCPPGLTLQHWQDQRASPLCCLSPCSVQEALPVTSSRSAIHPCSLCLMSDASQASQSAKDC